MKHKASYDLLIFGNLQPLFSSLFVVYPKTNTNNRSFARKSCVFRYFCHLQ